jgi:hypothetical protein
LIDGHWRQGFLQREEFEIFALRDGKKLPIYITSSGGLRYPTSLHQLGRHVSE